MGKFASVFTFIAAMFFTLVAHAGLKAGVGVVDVTPDFEGRPVPANNATPFAPLYQWGDPFDDKNGDGKFQFLYLAGFENFFPKFVPYGNRFATRVHDPIWSRAIAVEGASGQKTVLISVDSPGIMWKVIGPVRRKIAQNLGVPISNIIIAATHSHYAPDPYGFWWSLDPLVGKPYAEFLKQKMYESAELALKNMEDVDLKTITANTHSCYDPVTKKLKKDADCHMAPVRKEYLTEEDKLKGPYDEILMQYDKRDPTVRNSRVVAAQFISQKTSKTVGTIINWHNHPDSLLGQVMEVSSDYVHYVREFVESKLGGSAVYFSGTVGCQIGAHPGVAAPLWDDKMNPIFESNGTRTLITSNSWERVRSIGYEIGNEVVTSLQAVSAPIASDLVKIDTQSLDIPIEVWLHQYMTVATWTRDIEAADAVKHYAGRCGGKRGCVSSDMSVVQLGDLSFIAVPGEMDPVYFLGRKASKADYGKKWGTLEFEAMPGIDPFMPGKHHGVIGMANNFLAYFVPKADRLPNTKNKHPNYYEESVAVGSNQGDEIGDKLLEMLGSTTRFSK